MEQNIVLGLNWLIGIIITIVLTGLSGIAIIVKFSLSITDRLARVETRLNGIEKRTERIEGKVYNSMEDRSPLALTDKGEKVLKASCLKEYINVNKDVLIKKVNPEKLDPYDIQEKAADILRKHDFGATEITIRSAAYMYGMDVGLVKRIGSLYLRDLCLKEIGINPKAKPK